MRALGPRVIGGVRERSHLGVERDRREHAEHVDEDLHDVHVRERHPVDALVGEGAHLRAQQARLREELLLEAGAAEEDAVVDGLREARADPAENDVVALALGRAALDEAATALVEQGLAQWSGEAPGRGRSLIVRGRANLLEDSKAADDLDRVRQLFNELERQQSLLDILDTTREADGVRLFIGSENQLFPLSGSSVIVAPYMGGGKQVIGALGVIGPTRLNYARVIPMVDYTAKVVGEILTTRRTKDGTG